MTVVVAKLNYLRIAPRKVRLIADLIRGKKVQSAQSILSFANQKAAQVMLKLLNQAVSNAKNNLKLDETDLYISKITVDEGPKLKRFRPRARGSAFEIQKKTSHILINLEGQAGKKTKKAESAKESVKEAVSPTEEKAAKTQKPKFKPEAGFQRPKTEKTAAKIFRRQTF